MTGTFWTAAGGCALMGFATTPLWFLPAAVCVFAALLQTNTD